MIPHSRPTIGLDEIAAVTRVMRSGQLAQGKEVAAFEEECAAVLGWRYGVAVSSGTGALELALGALGVHRGAPVALPSYACTALPLAILRFGAKPVVCDVGEQYALDADDIPTNCGVVIQPHMFGARPSLPEGKTVIEDVAQSMGNEGKEKGAIGVTSFYATKFLATGEGGMVLTDDATAAEYVRDHRDYDNRETFDTRRFNHKMTDVQAAIGRVQLKRLPEFVARRREIAAQYSEAFSGLPVLLPRGDNHVFFRYVVESDAAELMDHLATRGVDAKRPVYRPAHQYPELAEYAPGPCPNADRAHDRCVSIPIYPSLGDAEVDAVIAAVVECVS